VLTFVKKIMLSILAGHKVQHFTVDIFGMSSFQLLTDVASYSYNIIHQHIHIGEDRCIDVLKHIIRIISFCYDHIGGIDQTIS